MSQSQPQIVSSTPPSKSPTHKTSTSQSKRTMLVSSTPTFGSPSFNIFDELSSNRDHYFGRDDISIYQFPSYLITQVDRIRTRIEELSSSLSADTADPKPPSVASTIACCLESGAVTISQHPDIIALIEVRRAFNLLDSDADSDLYEEIAGVFRTMPLSVPSSITSGSSKINAKVPDRIKSLVGQLSSDLGVSFSGMATLSVMVALSDQDFVQASRRAEMESGISLFIRRVRVRTRFMEGALKELTMTNGGKL